MDDYCAPQWADFTASPHLPCNNYFDVEHEIHKSRNRVAAENLEDSLENKSESTSLNFDTKMKVKGDCSTAQQSGQANLSFFVPLESKKAGKQIQKLISFPCKTIQNLRIEDISQNGKNRLPNGNTVLRRRTITFRRRTSQGETRAKVLTCQYVRKSLTKNHRRSNQFVSLAEAVSKFQRDTPQRFRTVSNKNLKPMTSTRTKQKLTYPVSPALRCKHRTRISANPATTGITTDSVVAPKNIFKKLAITTEEPSLNHLKNPKLINNQSVNMRSVLEHKEEQHKSIMLLPASSSTALEKKAEIPKKKAEISEKKVEGSKKKAEVSEKKAEASEKKEHSTIINNMKAVPRLPPAFEARNKEFQAKREQKIRALQEMGKAKAEFHAKPVPKFVKKLVMPTQQQMAKKSITPCPFSFDQRDKCLAKQKVERIKQLQQQDKKTHIFHANPVPSFKPVPVRSVSKENLKNTEQERPMTRRSRSGIGQENRMPNIVNSTIPPFIKRNEGKLKAQKDAQECQANTLHKKTVNVPDFPPVVLNTDKRAKERCEFDEKIRKKKMQEELERQQHEKKQRDTEKQEQMELRKLAEVRAKPMPVFKPPIILKSSKPLTSPKSPAWAARCKSMKHAS